MMGTRIRTLLQRIPHRRAPRRLLPPAPRLFSLRRLWNRKAPARVPVPWGEVREAFLTALAAAAAVTFAAHGFLFSNEFFSHDSISYFAYSDWGLPFYTSVGRFLIPIYEACKGNTASPWLIGLLFVCWMALTCFTVLLLLDLRRRPARILACALLCTNLTLTLTGATYIYCLDEYALALFLSAAAAYLFCRNWLWAPLGLLPLILSLSLYQPYFTVAASLCLLALFRDTVRVKNPVPVLLKGLRCLALLAAGYLLYDSLWTVVCAAVGTDRLRDAAPLLTGGIPGLLALLPGIYADFFSYLLTPSGVLGPLLPAVHLVLLALLAYKLYRLLTGEEGGPNFFQRVLLCLLACLLPAALRAVFVLIPDDAHDLTAYARELLYLAAVLIMDPRSGPADGPREREARLFARWHTAAAVLLCLVLWHHVVFANQVYMKKDMEKNATLVLAARIIDRIEAVEGYVPGETPVSFSGRMDYNTFLKNYRTEAFRDLSGYTGLWHNYAATYNLGRYLTEYLHYPLVWDQERNLSGLPEVRAMPVFPAEGSIQMVRGTVVVKFTWAVTGGLDGKPLPD